MTTNYTVTPASVLMLDGVKVAEFMSLDTAQAVAQKLNADRAQAAYFTRMAA